MVTLHYEFDLPRVSKSQRIFVSNYAVPNMMVYVIDKEVVSVYDV